MVDVVTLGALGLRPRLKHGNGNRLGECMKTQTHFQRVFPLWELKFHKVSNV